jgi:hypothetical protein
MIFPKLFRSILARNAFQDLRSAGMFIDEIYFPLLISLSPLTLKFNHES